MGMYSAQRNNTSALFEKKPPHFISMDENLKNKVVHINTIMSNAFTNKCDNEKRFIVVEKMYNHVECIKYKLLFSFPIQTLTATALGLFRSK